jgi:hypothetical protein
MRVRPILAVLLMRGMQLNGHFLSRKRQETPLACPPLRIVIKVSTEYFTFCKLSFMEIQDDKINNPGIVIPVHNPPILPNLLAGQAYVREFGTHTNNVVPLQEFRLIRLRGQDYLDQLCLDESVIGGDGGQDCGGYVLGDGEFINHVEIHWGSWIDKIIVGTNQRAPIAAGGTGGPQRFTLDNVHVKKMGACWGATHNNLYVYSITIEWEDLPLFGFVDSK